jgi:glyoxylase-like metal-dependent hydrolase (beta-lactamase superfamily II)
VAIGEGGNSLVVVGKDASAIVDSKNTGFGAALRREGGRFGGAVTTLINTHHHYDHTGGNSAFGGLEVITHEKAKPRLSANADRYKNGALQAVKQLEKSKKEKPAGQPVFEEASALYGELETMKPEEITRAFSPSKTVGDTSEVVVGGETIELRHFGAGHTDNDLVVRLAKKNVVHCGDLLFNQVWPYMDAGAGCTSTGWIASLRRILELCDDKTIVVPGHGAICDKKAVTAQIDFFEDMRAQAGEAVKMGTSREEFVKLTPEKYKGYAAGDWIRPITLGGVFDEQSGRK